MGSACESMLSIVVHVPARRARYELALDPSLATRGRVVDFVRSLLGCGVCDFELLEMRAKKFVSIMERDARVADKTEFMLVGPGLPARWAREPRTLAWSSNDTTLYTIFREKIPDIVPVIVFPSSTNAEWRSVHDSERKVYDRGVQVQPASWWAAETDGRYTALTAAASSQVHVLIIDATTWEARWFGVQAGDTYEVLKSKFTALDLHTAEGVRIPSDGEIRLIDGRHEVLYAYGNTTPTSCVLVATGNAVRARVNNILQPTMNVAATVYTPRVAIRVMTSNNARIVPRTVIDVYLKARARFDSVHQDVGLADAALLQRFAPDEATVLGTNMHLHVLSMLLVSNHGCWDSRAAVPKGSACAQLLRAFRYGASDTLAPAPVWFNNKMVWVQHAHTPQTALAKSMLWVSGTPLGDSPIGPQLPGARADGIYPIAYVCDNAVDRMVTIVTDTIAFNAVHVKLEPAETYQQLLTRIKCDNMALSYDWIGSNRVILDHLVDATRSPFFVLALNRPVVDLMPLILTSAPVRPPALRRVTPEVPPRAARRLAATPESRPRRVRAEPANLSDDDEPEGAAAARRRNTTARLGDMHLDSPPPVRAAARRAVAGIRSVLAFEAESDPPTAPRDLLQRQSSVVSSADASQSATSSGTTTEDSQSDENDATSPVLRTPKRKVFSDDEDAPTSPAKQAPRAQQPVNGKFIPLTDEVISDSSSDETPPKD